MSVEAKTVLLSECKGVLRIKREDECSFSDEVLTGYIEAEPLLDLLERFRDLPENCAQVSSKRQRLRDEASTLLRTHGRLSS